MVKRKRSSLKSRYMAKRAKYTATKKLVKKTIMATIETKQCTGGINSFIVTNGGSGCYNITRYFETGDNDNQFNGNAVSLRSFWVKLLVRIPNPADAQWCSQIRTIIVSTDAQINWDTSVPADFFYPLSSGTPAGAYALTSKVNVKKYSVLSDKIHQLTPVGSGETTNGYNRVITCGKSFKLGRKLEFLDTATSGTNQFLKNKNYYVVLVGGGWSNTTANIEYRGNLYCKYKDI